MNRARVRCGAGVIAMLAAATLALASCAPDSAPRATPITGDARAIAFLDSLEERTFRWFWDLSDARTGLTPDRWPTKSFVSVGAIGFALTAYPIGAERGWVAREAAAERTLTTLRYLWEAPQDSAAAGVTGYRGFFYHFLVPETGHRFETVELSTMDTALMLAGALFCQSYFDRDGATEASVRAYAESLYVRVDWKWAMVRPPTIVLGWDPENGHLPYDWRGYNEAMILHILALGSPSFPDSVDVLAELDGDTERVPAAPATWNSWTSAYKWGEFKSQPHVGFAALFGHQYSHVWIDFRGIQDEYMRERGIDYFENSRRATLAQHAYAIENPMRWRGYGPLCWGLTACDGPIDETHEIDGRPREFHTYSARGASFTNVDDDGTIAPTAAAGSIAFAPEIVIPTLVSMRDTYGDLLYGRYGFVDAFNPTLTLPVPVHHGRVDTRIGWFDTDYLGIDQGPIIAMIENYRSGLVWRVMRRNPHIVRGLRAAGFRGGWLDSARVE